MSEKYPYLPPTDAKEWTCPTCGCDALWCGRPRQEPDDEDEIPTPKKIQYRHFPRG